jgi:hypothetical protein
MDRRPIQITRHGAMRMAQRGTSDAVRQTILRHADLETYQRSDRRALQITQRRAVELMADGAPRSLVDKALSTVLIVDENGTVITVLRINPGQICRRRSFGRARRSKRVRGRGRR